MRGLRISVAIVGLVGLLGLIGIAAANGAINVRNPENAERGKSHVVPPPLFPPPAESTYTPHPADQPIVSPTGNSVAQFKEMPAGLQAVAVHFPTPSSLPAEDLYFTILASIRYTGDGRIVMVSTARPSPAAAQQPMLLGNSTINLADGSTAWVNENMPRETPTSVVTVKNDLIITVAGNLSTDELTNLAGQVVIRAKE